MVRARLLSQKKDTKRSKRSKRYGKYCCVVSCSNNYKTTTQRGQIHLYSFPGRSWEKERKQTWVAAVRRVNLDGSHWQPSKFARICSEHFVDGTKSDDPRSLNFNPTIFPKEYMCTALKDDKRYERLKARNNKESAISELVNDIILEMISEDFYRIIDEIIDEEAFEIYEATNSALVEHQNLLDSVCMQIDEASDSAPVEPSNLLDNVCMQIEEQLEPPSTQHAAVGPSYRTCSFNGFDSFSNNMAAMHNLTSVSSDAFSLLLGLLPEVSRRSHELRTQDKLLIFLMKLKLGISFTALGALFGIHRTSAARIFVKILNQLFDATDNWIFWPSRNRINKTMPNTFREHYPNCRVIIDCTEIKTERPSTIEQQNFMYSHYKGDFTLKYLIGIAPNGLITFLSKGYGGHSSDSFITTDCGLLNLLEKDDAVMADKGFPGIRPLLTSQFAFLVMPPFSKNNIQFTFEEMAETYSIASVRIHVERAIQRLKIFNILNNKVPVDLIPHMDKVLHVISILSSLQPRLIQKTTTDSE